HDVIREGGVLSHGYTYSGHPVACAVAIANIKIIEEEKLVERVHDDIGPYFRARLGDLVNTHPLVGELRRGGLLAGLQLMRTKETREFFTAEDKPAILCRDFCIKNHLIIRAVGTSMVLRPPLTISRA